MKKLNRRLVAATASVALALGIFAAVPLSAEAKTNYRIAKSIASIVSFDGFDGSTLNEQNVNGL